MKKNMPVFKVLYQEFNSGKIDFVNWFDFGHWNSIRKELMKMKRIFSKLRDSTLEEKNRMISKHFFNANKNFDYKKHDIVEFVVEEKLRNECIYHYLSKCEYEIVVKQWVGKETELKIDIYDQLNANWESFKKIVFEQVGL